MGRSVVCAPHASPRVPPGLYIGLCATTKLNFILNFSICCCCLNIV